MYTPSKPLSAYVGPKKPKLLLVGEAFGKDELMCREPFVGSAGKLLFELLGEAFSSIEPELFLSILDQHKYGNAWIGSRKPWFEAASIGMTNVLNFQPPANKIDQISRSKKQFKEANIDPGPLPAITRGLYLEPEYLPELDRLAEEIKLLEPNLVVALGNTAIWALLRVTNIGGIRGSTTMSNWAGPSVKVLPTYHPAAILYQWSWRTIVIADLIKAQREMAFAEIRRPQRRVLIDPTIEEVETYCQQLIICAVNHKRMVGEPMEIGCDTETAMKQIKMISFAPTKSEAIVIPFIDERKAGLSYWPEAKEEFRAWRAAKELFEHPCVRLVGQNFIYDLQYTGPMTLRPSCVPEDTMMLHHSLYPEMKKSLGFLGSIYTDEASWKLMRNEKADTEKRDE